MKNAVLINLPITELLYPSAGLAAIAPVFKKNGYRVTMKDINLQLAEEVSDRDLQTIYHWCELSKPLPKDAESRLDAWLKNTVTSWHDLKVDCFAVSVFSYHSIVFAQKILQILRATFPQAKIIVGGNGVSSNLKNITDHTTFGQQILSQSWANHVIFGEGELSLDALLKDKSHPGINVNNPQQIHDLDQLDPPDYQDFDFSRYRDKRLLITGSRGCVRHCTFCDIDLTWPKFKYRSAESQANEIITHAKKYGITRFEFTDSLINGSVSGWIKFNELLANAKEKDPELKDISYSGQFICRDRQSQPAIMYELMHYAGARQITVGIESFSNKIRDLMKKKFSNDSIDYHLEQCAKWGIPNIFLMLVGHPEETLDDHQCNVDALYRYKKYSDMGTIFMMRWGTTMHIIKDTPVYRDGNHEIVSDDDSNADSLYTWINRSNPSLTLAERVRRRLELHCLSYQLGYSQPNSRAELTTISGLLDKYDPQSISKIMNRSIPIVSVEPTKSLSTHKDTNYVA